MHQKYFIILCPHLQAGEVSLDLATHVILGIKFTQTDPTWIRDKFKCFMRGLYVLPVPFPGTAYSKALKARKELADKLWAELQVEVLRVTDKVCRPFINQNTL